jgi:hypothetical protein
VSNRNVSDSGFLKRAFRILRIVAPLLAIAIGAGLSFRGDDYLEGVGGSILAAGVIGLVGFLIYGDLSGRHRQAQLDQHEALLNEVKDSCARLEDHKKRDEVAKRIGLDDCYERRPDPEIEQAVLQATDRVDILEVSMDTMRELDSSDWLNCRAEVRIILLDPVFPENQKTLADLRDEEEEQGKNSILSEIRTVLRSLPEEWMGDDEEEEEEESRVRLAKVMPTMSYFRIDDMAYFAPLVYRKLGNRTMHMRLRKHGDLFDVLERNFEKLWEDTEHVRPAVPARLLSSNPSAGFSDEHPVAPTVADSDGSSGLG